MRESKNSADLLKPQASYDRGLWAEERAIEFLSSEVIYRRWRTPFGEVDLIVRNSEGKLKAIEVKCHDHEGFEEFRLPLRQKRRLRRTWSWLIENLGEIEFLLIYVDAQGACTVIEDFL